MRNKITNHIASLAIISSCMFTPLCLGGVFEESAIITASDSEVNDRDNTKKADIDDFGYYHITTTHDTLEQHQQQGPETEALTTPYLLYALANQTVVDTNSGNTTIMFASTSVYFEGTCKQ